jgi:hypothetical protein
MDLPVSDDVAPLRDELVNIFAGHNGSEEVYAGVFVTCDE